MQWMTLFQKELLENWRNRKWIWVPIAFMLLSIMDPLSYYYLPEIVEFAGGVPDGAIIDIPKLEVAEVIMTSLEELSMFGIILIALFTMGTIAGERKSGQTEMILVRPISYTNYITTKWVAYLLLTWTALTLGMLLSWYYTNLLYGDLSFLILLKVIVFYGIWLSFVISLSFFFHTICKSPGVVAACTVVTVVVMSGVNMAFGHRLTYFPNQLSTHISNLIVTGNISTDLMATAGIIVLLIGILLVASINIFKTKEVVQQ